MQYWILQMTGFAKKERAPIFIFIIGRKEFVLDMTYALFVFLVRSRYLRSEGR
jgi:hypothetical protein